MSDWICTAPFPFNGVDASDGEDGRLDIVPSIPDGGEAFAL